MMKSTVLVVLLLMVVLLFAFACTSAYAEGEVLPWGVERIRANLVWDYNNDMVVDDKGVNGSGIRIAVIDTGIDYWTDAGGNIYYHPDLADNVAGGRGFRHWMCQVEMRSDHKDLYKPPYGHGTLVTGVIVAVDNAIGVIGTAPKAKIYALKYFTFWGESAALEVAAAINYAVNYLFVDIISISLGWTTDYPELRQACDNAYARRALLIAAAGNENGPVLYPAAYDSVIAVGAVYPNDTRWEDSNFGSELELMAPGVDIYSTGLNGGYATDTGTSFACPHVTGAAALIFSSKVDPKYDDPDYGGDGDGAWDNFEVRKKLQDTALDLGSSDWDQYYGYGLVNAWYAVQRPPADITGSTTRPFQPPDGRVDYRDLYVMLKAYNSKPGDPNWEIIVDITIDNKVDYQDLYILLANHGKTDP